LNSFVQSDKSGLCDRVISSQLILGNRPPL
jgi:hypothetical protein